jgi:uncharacterized membrane protein YraQ (UPF0718 family)
MNAFHVIAGIALGISLVASREKTWRALKVAWKRFSGLLTAFGFMLVFVSLFLYFLPDAVIARYLGNVSDPSTGLGIGLLLGSFTIMPGFIAFPLCGILLTRGATFMTLSAFSTALMMVGVLTFPMERHFLGTRATLLRNALSLLIAAAVAIVTGFVFGEIQR